MLILVCTWKVLLAMYFMWWEFWRERDKGGISFGAWSVLSLNIVHMLSYWHNIVLHIIWLVFTWNLFEYCLHLLTDLVFNIVLLVLCLFVGGYWLSILITESSPKMATSSSSRLVRGKGLYFLWLLIRSSMLYIVWNGTCNSLALFQWCDKYVKMWWSILYDSSFK